MSDMIVPPEKIQITSPGAYRMTNQVYHSHPTPVPSLSAGIAKILLKRSPSHAWTAHPACPWHEPKHDQSWDLGSAAHDVLLEGESNCVVIPEKDYRKDATKLARDKAYMRGQIPVLTHQLDEVREFVAAIRAQISAHEDDADAFMGGEPELSFFWQEANGVWCQCRPDYFHSDFSWVDHLKTTGTSTNPDTVSRWAMDQGHDLIDAWYRRGIKAVTGRSVPGRFISVEGEKPYGLTTFVIPKEIQQMADEQVELAIRTWGHCLETGRWPGYGRRRIELDVPSYMTKVWEERRERAKFPGADKFDPLLAQLIYEGFKP